MRPLLLTEYTLSKVAETIFYMVDVIKLAEPPNWHKNIARQGSVYLLSSIFYFIKKQMKEMLLPFICKNIVLHIFRSSSFNLPTLIVNITYNHFSDRICRDGDDNADEARNVTRRKDDCNDGERMDVERFPHDVWCDKIAFNLLDNECYNRDADDAVLVLPSMR